MMYVSSIRKKYPINYKLNKVLAHLSTGNKHGDID